MADKFKVFHHKSSLRCNEKLIELNRPLIMGIVNITPDSFYMHSRKETSDEIISAAGKMLDEGADIIDIGAISTRPGANLYNEEIEQKRLFPVLELLNSVFPDIIISVDTFRSSIASIAVEKYHAGIINDISGGSLDGSMFQVIADLQVPYVIMHIKGTPENMQFCTNYTDLISEILGYFSQRIDILRESGVNDIIIDPGFGFGKTIDQNYEILNKLDLFQIFELPVLAGLSRKSMIYKFLGIDAENSLNGTTVLNTLALLGGADILRVHDVKEAKEAIMIFQKYLIQENSENGK